MTLMHWQQSHFKLAAERAGYCLCRILHMAMIVSDDSARGKSELEGFMNGYQETGRASHVCILARSG